MSEIIPIEISPEMRITVLNREKLEMIHQATLTVLEETGVKFPSEKALQILGEGGAHIDRRENLVRFPSDFLMNALSNAPRAYKMSSRGSTDTDMYLDGKKTYFGTDGTGTTTVDLETRQRRASTKKDVEITALISDYLPSISFYWPVVSAQDMPSAVIPLHELEGEYGQFCSGDGKSSCG